MAARWWATGTRVRHSTKAIFCGSIVATAVDALPVLALRIAAASCAARSSAMPRICRSSSCTWLACATRSKWSDRWWDCC